MIVYSPCESCHSALLDSNFKVFLYIRYVFFFFWSSIEKLIHLLFLVTPFEQLLNMYFGFYLDANGPGCGWISTLCKRYNKNRQPKELTGVDKNIFFVHNTGDLNRYWLSKMFLKYKLKRVGSSNLGACIRVCITRDQTNLLFFGVCIYSLLENNFLICVHQKPLHWHVLKIYSRNLWHTNMWYFNLNIDFLLEIIFNSEKCSFLKHSLSTVFSR